MNRVFVAAFVVAVGVGGGAVACSSERGAEDGPTASAVAAVTQPPESQRDKCHGAPSCMSPRNEPGCRVRGECVELASCEGESAPDPCDPARCCDTYTLDTFGTCTDAGAYQCPSSYPYLRSAPDLELLCCTEPSSEISYGSCQPYTKYCR